jgi:CPA2 family monovalent cation:H+ antiporter-2
VIASHSFLEDLAMVLCVAAVTTVIFQKIRQPVVVGYLIAGLIVGPYVPIPLLADPDRIHTISELGVILLMFALGLEFSLGKLLELGPTSGFITILQCGLMIWIGYVCGTEMGWTPLESIFTGSLLSISSTTIVAKAYDETPVPRQLRELVFGVLLAEDLTAVVQLAVLTTLASGVAVSASLMTVTVARLVLFLVALLGIGIVVVPRLMRFVVGLGRPETTLVASIGVCFAFAIIAEHAGYSVALGAFLGGSLVAESGEAAKIEHLVAPVRDMFGAVFFVSVGMMINPALIAQHWVALIVLTVAVLIGKTVGVTIASSLAGVGTKTSIQAGMSLAQIGEFSFIIAGVALQTHAARDFLYTLAVAVSAVTTFLTPYMIQASTPVSEYVSRHLPTRLQMFESMYASWFEQIRKGTAPPSEEGHSIWWPIVTLASSAILLAAILITNEIDPLDVTTIVANLEHVSYFTAGLFVDAFALLLCSIPIAGIYYASRKLATALAARAIPEVPEHQTAAAKALVELLQVAILIVIAMPLLAIVQPFIAPFEGVAVMVIAAVLMTIVVVRNTRRIEGELLDAARLITEALASPRRAPSSDGVSYEVPGLGVVTPVIVRPDSASVGKRLRDIDLHATTGAMVVAIARGDSNVMVPNGDEVIQPGDVLELAGSSEAVTAAARLINGPGGGPAHQAALQAESASSPA